MPWLFPKKAIRIWLTASEKARATRVGSRDDIPREQAKKEIRSRLKQDAKLWKNLYGIRFGKDMKPFDLVVNNETFSKEDTFNAVKAFLDGKMHGKN
jgi:cytidylate kinase